MIKEFNTSEIFQKHFRNDEAWFYHLNEIEFDLFVTLHFKNQEYYANTIQSDCNRKRVFRETFGNITKWVFPRLRIGMSRNMKKDSEEQVSQACAYFRA